MFQWLEEAFSSPAFSDQKPGRINNFLKIWCSKARFYPLLISSKKGFLNAKYLIMYIYIKVLVQIW